MKNGIPSLPAASKGCDFFITLKISSSNIDMGEGILAEYEAMGISVRSALGIGGKNLNSRAFAFSAGVVAVLEEVTRLGIVGGVRGRWLLSLAHFASSQIPLLPLAASATACLKCAALAFLMVAPLALSASRYALQALALGCLLCPLLALLAFLTSWVSSLDHQGTEKGAGFDKGMCWATASFIHLTNLSTPASMSSQFS
jgi:hypothetical protein